MRNDGFERNQTTLTPTTKVPNIVDLVHDTWERLNTVRTKSVMMWSAGLK